MINSIIFLALIIFFAIHIRLEIKEHIRDYKAEHKWDEWDKIKGAFDIMNAERNKHV